MILLEKQQIFVFSHFGIRFLYNNYQATLYTYFYIKNEFYSTNNSICRSEWSNSSSNRCLDKKYLHAIMQVKEDFNMLKKAN